MEGGLLQSMRIRNNFGEIIVPKQLFYGISIESTEKVAPNDFKNAIFFLKDRSTGFLVSLSETMINGSLQKVGLLLTTAHSLTNIKTGLPHKSMLTCTLGDSHDKAYFLKEFTTHSSVEYTSISTGCDYYLPGDIAILLIILKQCEPSGFFEPFDFSESIPSMPCYIPGYATFEGYPRNRNPELTINEKKIKKNIHEILRKKKKLTFSHGQVLHESNTLIEVSCSTACLMSGAPIISQGKFLGIYVGGPPLPGQRELMRIISHLRKQEFEEVSRLVDDLKAFDYLYENSIVKEFRGNYEFSINMFKGEQNKSIYMSHFQQDRIEWLIEKAFGLIFELSRYYRQRDGFYANIGISYKNDIFRKLDLFIQGFSTVANMSFVNIAELIVYLTTF
jgi:hypothetical protein